MKSSAMWLSLFGLSSVLIIILSIFLISLKQTKNSSPNTQTETSTWPTYTNLEDNYEISYPPQYAFYEADPTGWRTEPPPFATPNSNVPEIYLGLRKENKSQETMYLSISNYPYEHPNENHDFNSDWTSQNISGFTKFTNPKSDWEYYIFSEINRSEKYPYTLKIAVDKTKLDSQTVSHILSTFKFTN